jgi:hypothetical protein
VLDDRGHGIVDIEVFHLRCSGLIHRSWITGEIQLVLGRTPEACHRLIPQSSSSVAFFLSSSRPPAHAAYLSSRYLRSDCTSLNVLPGHVLLGNQDAAYRKSVIVHATNVFLKRTAYRI